MENKYVEQSQIDKKLCIHCKHCEIYGCGFEEKIMCSLYRSPVDDKELYSAFEARTNNSLCGGKHWELSPEIIICQSKEEAFEKREEQSINTYMETARKIINGEQKMVFTCGYLEKAIKRVNEFLENGKENKNI